MSTGFIAGQGDILQKKIYGGLSGTFQDTDIQPFLTNSICTNQNMS